MTSKAFTFRRPLTREQLGAAVQVTPLDQRAQLLGFDDALEAELGCPAAVPHAGRLARAHEVVLHALGDRGDEVLSADELGDGQHRGAPASATSQTWQVSARRWGWWFRGWWVEFMVVVGALGGWG